jgi:hypothetical protein
MVLGWFCINVCFVFLLVALIALELGLIRIVTWQVGRNLVHFNQLFNDTVVMLGRSQSCNSENKCLLQYQNIIWKNFTGAAWLHQLGFELVAALTTS